MLPVYFLEYLATVIVNAEGRERLGHLDLPLRVAIRFAPRPNTRNGDPMEVSIEVEYGPLP